MSRRTIDEQARRHLWLWPLWMRPIQGEEAVGLVLDQAGERSSLSLRSRLDLVRAGIGARRRGTPPVEVLWEVFTADLANSRGTIPLRWRPWLLTWAGATHWRRYLWGAWALVVTAVFAVIGVFELLSPSSGITVATYPMVLVGVSLGAQIRAERWRTCLLARNGIDEASLLPIPPQERAWSTVPPLVPPLRVDRVAGWTLLGTSVVGAGAMAVGLASGSPLRSNAAGMAIGFAAVLALVGGPAWRATRGGDPRGEVPDDRWERRRPLPSQSWSRARWRAPVTVALAAVLLVVAAYLGAAICLATDILAAVVLVRARRFERRTGQVLDLWDLVPALGPRPVFGRTRPLPPPPDPSSPGGEAAFDPFDLT